MIQKAEYIHDYQIRVWFTDGREREINLSGFLSQSNNPFIRKYLDVALFRQFRIEYGTLCWGDNDMDISPQKILSGVYDNR
jgi:hypothetical protein